MDVETSPPMTPAPPAMMLAAFAAAAFVCLAPGFFWARTLAASRDFYVKLAFSAGLSFAFVPAVAVLLTNILGGGVTLPVAVAAPSLVFVSGLAANLVFGNSKTEKEAPASEKPAPMGGYALSLFAVAAGVASLAFFGIILARASLLPVAILIVFAGAAHLVTRRQTPDEGETAPLETVAGETYDTLWRVLRISIPTVVFALVAFRYYLGVALHDWPYLRGGDLYSHAVMANRMMDEGEILPYLVYPPGFHTITAILSRLTTLDPLEIFATLVPALFCLPSLAAYALATKLWGWRYGVAAAALSGLVLAGTYSYFDVAMYPNVSSSQFLLPMAVAALVLLYANPTLRSAALVAALGSSVVLFHPIGSFYAAMLFGAVGVLFVPYLLVRRRREGVALLGAFAALGVLAVAYAWGTYDLPSVIGGVLGGGESGSGGYAVESAIGTQGSLPIENFLESITAPVLWLGLLGSILIAFAKRDGTAGFLSRYTLLLWAAILFVGSRTALSGFPVRFERDLGIPLALLAAFALGAVVKSLWSLRLDGRSILAVAAASVVAVLFAAQISANFEEAGKEPSIFLMTPGISEAGSWLREHNEGGNIIVGPHQNQVPSRAMLAMGEYSALQSFTPSRISYDRDLPPHGPEPMWDVLRAINEPGEENTRRILAEYDIRYVVFYKRFDPATTWGSVPTVEWWLGYEEHPGQYEKAFENESVVVFEPRLRAEAHIP